MSSRMYRSFVALDSGLLLLVSEEVGSRTWRAAAVMGSEEGVSVEKM